jgi:hypothetical protein
VAESLAKGNAGVGPRLIREGNVGRMPAGNTLRHSEAGSGDGPGGGQIGRRRDEDERPLSPAAAVVILRGLNREAGDLGVG